MKLDKKYWNDRYLQETIGWDVGFPTPPITDYIKTISNKDISILIPGAGHGHEVIHLHKQGFKNVWVCDWSQEALNYIHEQIPDFPKERLICDDFFNLKLKFDLIFEQTFFCALNPTLRTQYIDKIHSLLEKDGKLVGILFSKEFDKQGPPFGGNHNQYTALFDKLFDIQKMEPAYNSIPPRDGSEYFITMRKQEN